MSKETFFLDALDGHRIVVQKWVPRANPKAIIQISHGMAEYAGRYDYFAQKAIEQGFVVYAHDHRGHGESAKNEDDLGFLSESNGFNKVVVDLNSVINKAKEEYRNIPIVLFAHSFGSFVGQRYIQLFGDSIDAIILSGSKGPDPVLVWAAKFLANVIALLKGKRHKSKLLTDLAFGSHNARIPDAKSTNSWLTRDELEVEKYDASPWCGFTCTAGFYCDLMEGLSIIHKKKNLETIPQNLPILITGGAEDPVNSYGTLQKSLYQIYLAEGIQDVQIKLYEGGRHEMINEINKDEFILDLFTWINSKLS